MQSLKKILLTAVFIPLGVVACFIEERPEADLDALQLTFAEFDEIVQQQVKKIKPLKLAELLMKQDENYYLLDIDKGRQHEEEQYQIPTAEKYDLNLIKQSNWRLNDNIIVYSENEIEALQAYYLLTIRGFFNVRVLSGGIVAWKKDVLYPNKAEIEFDLLKQREKTTRFFGGEFSDSQSSPDLIPNPIQLIKQKHQRHGC